MKQWVVVDKENGFDSLNFKEGPVPQCGENEVLVKLRAASLNYRDLIIPKVRHFSDARDGMSKSAFCRGQF
jgi:NADPH:quinone reductase-like Zn-dependent oxidoreductase